MKLAHTMIRVKDLDATLDFYTGFLGMTETRRKALGDDATLVFLDDGQGDHQIELTVNHGKDDYDLGDQFGHLAFFTDDLDEVVREVESRGWWYRRSGPGMTSKYIFVKDPNGYDIEILEKARDVSSSPSKTLETFENPNSARDYEIRFHCPEFTCVCPKTGQPDFASLKIDYVPDRLCVELKSLKLYLWSYRDEGHFHEGVTNRILDDLVRAVAPRRMRIEGHFNVRGGIRTVVVAQHPG